MGVDAAFKAAAPRVYDDVADRRMSINAGQEIFPRAHDRRFIGIGRATRRRCRPVPCSGHEVTLPQPDHFICARTAAIRVPRVYTEYCPWVTIKFGWYLLLNSFPSIRCG